MGSHPPAVPPASRSNKGPGESGRTDEDRKTETPRDRKADTERGQRQSVTQNTRNPGFQQDR